jgi:hypothetical protein
MKKKRKEEEENENNMKKSDQQKEIKKKEAIGSLNDLVGVGNTFEQPKKRAWLRILSCRSRVRFQPDANFILKR